MSSNPISNNNQEVDLTEKSKDFLFKRIKEKVDGRQSEVIRVYSFRPISEYLFNELFFGYLSCSPVSSFNDPLDCPLFLYLVVGSIKAGEYSHYERLMNSLFTAASCLRIRCFSSDTTDDSAIPLNTLMWAHYANSHKGILLCYELPNILENDNERVSFFEKVIYSDSFKNLKRDSLGGARLATDLLPMVSTKVNLWEYEKEIRLIHYNKQEESDYPEIKIKKNYLKKIYFGLRTSEFDRQRFEQLAQHYPNLELFDIRSDPDNLLALKCFRHEAPKQNILDYVYLRYPMPNYQIDFPRAIEIMFRGAIDDLIMDTDSVEECISRYENLSEKNKYYAGRAYVALFKEEQSKVNLKPNSINELDTLVKEVIKLYYSSRRNIHIIRDYLGIKEYYEEKEEID